MGVFLCEFESRHPHKKQRPDFRSLFLFYKPGLRRYKQETEADDSVSVSMSGYCDSNTGPSGPKPDALANCATPRIFTVPAVS